VLTTTMTFSALAAGLAHPEAVVEAVRNPLGLQALFTADSFPWQQVRPPALPPARSNRPLHGRLAAAAAAALHTAATAPATPSDGLQPPSHPATHPPAVPHRTAPPQVLYTGLLTTDLALMMEVFALQDVSSVDAAIIYTLEPVLGAGLAWAMLGERLGAKGLAGAAIILASSLATQVLGGGGAEAAAAADAEE
jgi:hypothetical protein